MAVVVCPTITQAVVESVNILENVEMDYANVVEQISTKLQPVMLAEYPHPKTKPNIRLVLPLLINSLHDELVFSYNDRDKLYVRRYVAGLLRRDFPEIFPPKHSYQTNQQTNTQPDVPRHNNVPTHNNGKPSIQRKKNKDKYNKETRNKKKMNAI